jgi:hypothetical protein
MKEKANNEDTIHPILSNENIFAIKENKFLMGMQYRK